MNSIINRLDDIEQTVMAELKDFQKATVERIDYLYRMGHNRILVSDEVGLGKTLVARGTIAKFAKLRKEEGDDLVKVVYICSNAAIAEQNLDKLRIVNEIRPESTSSSRLSMQHLNIFMQESNENVINRYIQLIPLTPQTSFKVTNSQGTMNERALICEILKRVPEFKRYRNNLDRIFRFEVNENNWRNTCNWYEDRVNECNKKSNGKYIEYMVRAIVKELKSNDLWESFGHIIRKRTSLDKREVKPYIVKLRLLFADISLNKLDPDLIIMDEFQRFRYLLNSDENSEMDRITNKFFSSDDSRILMLSATPYKMYSTLDEIDEEQIDTHYKEFFDVIDFLNNSDEEKQEFREIWNDYSIKLKEFNKDKTAFILAKNNAEAAMFKNICRTERITENQLGDIIDSTDAKNQLNVLREDITSYMDIQQLLDDIGLNVNVPMDYVKSSPYLMSFMKHYQLKRKIARYFKNNVSQLDKIKKDTFWLNENEINNYKKISSNNARLDNLMSHVLKDNASNLLWCPPSLPYYELDGPFKDCGDFSKTLIFSSWEMVPRMISSMVSYEIERQTIGQLKRAVNYFAERRYPYPRMTFSLSEDKPTQMTLFSLIYPSQFLVNVYNPIDCLNRGLSLSEIEHEVKSKIRQSLDKIEHEETFREDLRWYYLAPMLLDYPLYVNSWFKQSDRLVKSGYYFRKGFLTHYKELKNQYFDINLKLGSKPDDLEDVLCNMALASPAICTYRAYEKELPENMTMDEFRYAPTQIGRKFIDRMNLPESIAVIDLNSKSTSEDAYWKNVLKYSKQGNLQAVFDEYIHLLSNGLDRNNEDRILIINNKFLTSFEFRTASYDVDTFNTFEKRMKDIEHDKVYLRTHFAVSFTKGKSDEQDTNRKKSVRDAFNSPFRPFVLASTSIGQEGLDFHNYCRRIVHWNLPSNPIDLEQREGRINRFECLAIRQNLAKRYSLDFKNDVWGEIFKTASENEKVDGCSDLIPYWGLTGNDMVKIERIVPIYPFSRDEIKYDRLIKILSLYRLTLGQARQEELLESLIKRFVVDEKDITELFINLSPFYKDPDSFKVEKIERPTMKKELEIYDSFEEEIIEKPIDRVERKEFQSTDLSFNLLRLTTNNRRFAGSFNGSELSSFDYNEYWRKLAAEYGKSLCSWDNQCFWISISGVELNLARIELIIQKGFLEVKLYHANIKQGKKLFNYLFNLRAEIEEGLGFELFWDNKTKKSHYWKISIFVPIDINSNEDEAIKWHLYMAKRFDEVFSDRIREYFNENPLKYDGDVKARYWFELSNKLSNTDLITCEIPNPNTNHYWIFFDDVPLSECHLELLVNKNKKWRLISSIRIGKPRRDLYNHLLKDKLAIEEECGFELEWRQNRGSRYIEKTYNIDIRDESNWDEVIDLQLSTAQKFKEVFNSRINEFYNEL